jgi:putative DNA primase/helicase
MNKLIKSFGADKRWVNYRLEKRGDKMSKLPVSPFTGKLASSTNPKDWATYAVAKKTSSDVGIVFTPDQTVLGIDIDHCLTDNKITHEEKNTIADLILEADTYTELSPSGEGLHLIFKIDSALALTSNKKAPYEAYTSGRYFTFTGNCYGEERDVRTVSTEEALRILAIIGYPWKQPAQSDVGQSALVISSSLSDEKVITKMFKAKGGEKVKDLYNGSLADHKDDASSADMALCSHLAFWCGKDASQMERLWLASPLGQRTKTQDRADYRIRTIGNAIKACTSVYETQQMKMEKENPDLNLLYITGKDGAVKYLQNTENMCRILRHHKDFLGTLRYDSFKNILETFVNNKWKTIDDNDAVRFQTEISILFPGWFGGVGKLMIYDAMIKVAKENEIDSAADFIRSIVWDKKDRLDSWLTSVYGVPDDVYHRAVGSNWMKGLVKRIVSPGCKFDYVLVLEGEQGSKKSTSLSVLGSDWHVETTMSTDSKDFFMQFQGKAIIEFSEGETLSRTEVKRMKAIITMQSDKYRPPYERTSQDFPRRCVFAMTTNQSEYLKDETGNRRWLAVAVILPEADVEWLQENRDQLFAEAYHRVHVLNESTWEFPREETLAAQQARRVSDPNEDIISEWYYSKVSDSDQEEGVTIDRCFKEALHGNFVTKPITKFEQMSIATVFREVLKLDKRRAMIGGQQSTRWYKSDSTIVNQPTLSDLELQVKEF